MEGGEVGFEGGGDAGGRANGATGEDEGVAGVARVAREEVAKAREAAVIAEREGRLEDEGLVAGEGETFQSTKQKKNHKKN